jgi:hypothetical protein
VSLATAKAKHFTLVLCCYSPVQKSTENFVFRPKICKFLEGGNERGRIATPTSFSIFDPYEIKSLRFKFGHDIFAHTAGSDTIFFSYLLTCVVDLFEFLDIMAQMWHYVIFFSRKPTNVTSGFILNYLKKVIGGTTTQKNLKTNTKNHDIYYTDAPPGTPGVPKDAPLSTKQAHGGLVR